MNTIATHNGEVIALEGERASELLVVAALVESLNLESLGIMLSPRVTAQSIARKRYAKPRAKLPELIALAKAEVDTIKSECVYEERA